MNTYNPEQLRVATEIATALDEVHAIALYVGYVRRFPEPLLRKCLAKALRYDESKITKSRAALFAHMIHHPNYYEDLRS